MTNIAHGIKAEAQAAKYLQDLGYKIIEQNWKTVWCEIDIIARKDDTMYFVEVKFRMYDTSGNGLEYITPKKLKQMSRAAEGWVQIKSWMGNYQLAAIEVSGENFEITNYLSCLT
jgi:putative endonuclease